MTNALTTLASTAGDLIERAGRAGASDLLTSGRGTWMLVDGVVYRIPGPVEFDRPFEEFTVMSEHYVGRVSASHAYARIRLTANAAAGLTPQTHTYGEIVTASELSADPTLEEWFCGALGHEHVSPCSP